MSTDSKNQNDRTAFAEMIRTGLPALIERATDGAVVQTADRRVLTWKDMGEDIFRIFLNNGAAYQFRIAQLGEAEEAEVGCQQCGELLPAPELDEHGSCPSCAIVPWNQLTANEKSAWCTEHHQHYPYEEKGPMSPEKLRWIGQLLEAHPFRFAKTMKRNPHWYTLRHEWQDVGDEVYTGVITAIREHGYTEWFGTYPWRMLNVNGFKYWSYYSAAPEEVIVLNRKPLPGQETPEEDASR